jgi:hypothetical protein
MKIFHGGPILVNCVLGVAVRFIENLIVADEGCGWWDGEEARGCAIISE